MNDIDPSVRAREILGFSRWWQVVAAAVMMALISPYQYVWSSIQGPLATSLDVPLSSLGLVFSLFVIVQAGSQFPMGWWRDRHGPRNMTLLAGVLAGGGYLGIAYATTVWQLYVLYSLGALGVGIVYTVAVNTALKWFPDRRGLTTGVGTMAFAMGSALFIPYVRANATVTGFDHVLRNMGLLIGVGILAGALVLRDPPKDWLDRSVTEDGSAGTDDSQRTVSSELEREFTPREVLRTWQFWWMYAMFVAVSGAGLMLTAQIVSFAEHLGLAALVATSSAVVLPISGGVGRLVIGDLSDRMNRTYAMAGSFLACGLGLYFVTWFGITGVRLGFVAAVGVATFFWSAQYTLFPSVVGDFYGEKHSSTNYALLYSGKMWGGLFGGGVVGWLISRIGWELSFAAGGTLAVLAGLGALLLSRPSSSTAEGGPEEGAKGDDRNVSS